MTQVSRKGFVDKNGQKVVIVPKVPGATSGNLASFDEDGNLTDSGAKPADFAETNHGHDKVGGQYTHDNTATMAQAGTYKSDDNKAHFNIVLKDDIKAAGAPKVIDVNTENADNLKRALENPDSVPRADSDKLLTSGAMYEALLNVSGIASVNLHATVVKDNSSYTYFGVKYGSSTEEENWPEGDPEGMYAELSRALGETGNAVIPFELTVKNGSNVVQSRVLGFVYYTQTSYTEQGETSYNHNYKFCIGSFVYDLDISENHGNFDFPTNAFVGNNSVNSL